MITTQTLFIKKALGSLLSPQSKKEWKTAMFFHANKAQLLTDKRYLFHARKNLGDISAKSQISFSQWPNNILRLFRETWPWTNLALFLKRSTRRTTLPLVEESSVSFLSPWRRRRTNLLRNNLQVLWEWLKERERERERREKKRGAIDGGKKETENKTAFKDF